MIIIDRKLTSYVDAESKELACLLLYLRLACKLIHQVRTTAALDFDFLMILLTMLCLLPWLRFRLHAN